MYGKTLTRNYRTEPWTAIAVYAALLAAPIRFARRAGFPRLPMFSVWIVMGSSRAVVCLARAWRGRLAPA